jgi:hypothetical protein
MRAKERHTPWQSSSKHAGDLCNVYCIGEARGMLPSLLFLLVLVVSLLGNIRGDAMRSDYTSDVELSWYRDTTGKSMEDVIKKLAK